MLMEFKNYCERFLEEVGDPRTSNWFLLKSPTTVLFITIFYVLVVTKIGPKFMEHRKPFNISKLIQLYNFVQIILSSYIFYELVMSAKNYSIFRCNCVDYSDSPSAMRAVSAIYSYYLAKYTEYIDTIFFVLRKKYNQISFLHVYHHTSMPVLVYIVLRTYPGGTIIFPLAINSFIHIVMYTYYLISSLGPQFQKYLWWKKYMTTMQLIQFFLGMLYILIIIYTPGSECNIPKTFVAPFIMKAAFFTILLCKFYQNEYKENNLRKSKTSETTSNGKIE